MAMRILIVDDEVLIALDVEETLKSAGYEIAGMAGDVDGALRTIEAGAVDFVILDGDLGGESAEPVARRLDELAVPYVVASGYSQRQLAWLGEAPLIQKPYGTEALLDAIDRISSGKET